MERRLTRSFTKLLAARSPPPPVINGVFHITDSISNAPVDALAGISTATAKRLNVKGWVMAYQLVGQLLVLKFDTRLFIFWLEDEFGMSRKDATLCYNDVAEWLNSNL